MPERIQLNLRLDGYADLLQEAKEKAGYEGKSLNQWVIDQIRLGVGRSLEETDPALDKAVERLDRYLDCWLEDEIDEKIGEQVRHKLLNSHLIPIHVTPIVEDKLAEALDTKLAELNNEINLRLDIMLDAKLVGLAEQLVCREVSKVINSPLPTNSESSDPATWVTLHEESADSACELAANVGLNKGLSQRKLAERLGCDPRRLQERRNNPEELLEWTKERGGVGWEYREGRYYALQGCKASRKTF